MTPPIKQLKASEIKKLRDELLIAQEGICPLCEEEVTTDEATLDHDYVTGHCRAVLHRSCNGAEGRVLKWAGQMSRGKDHILWLKNLAIYWEKDWSHNPLHPKHGKPKVKRKRATAKTKSTGYKRKKPVRMKRSRS